jgi:hypothetical protein
MESSMGEERNGSSSRSSGSKVLLPLERGREADAGGAETLSGVLFTKAFLVVPGPKYNQVSYEMREQSGERVTFYEVVLSDEQGWRHLREKVYPSFTRFLSAKSIDPLHPGGIVVSLFHGDHFYLIDAALFMRAYRELEGIDEAGLRSRVRQWLAV